MEPGISKDDDLVGCTDAKKWANRFVRRVREQPSIASDEGAMTAWFACAIEAGRDSEEKQLRREVWRKAMRLEDDS